MDRAAQLTSAKAMLDARQDQPAVDALGRLLLEHPDDAEAHALLAETLLRMQRWEEGLASVDRLLALDPKSTWALRLRCVALENLDRYDEEIAAAREVIRLEPQNANAYFLLGKGFFQSGRDPEARAALEEAARLDPDVPLYRHTLSKLLHETVPAVARALLERIVRDEPGHALALNDLGVLLEKQGDAAGAHALYQRAVQADPSLELAKKNLKSSEMRATGLLRVLAGGLLITALVTAPFVLGGSWLSAHGHPIAAGVVGTLGAIAFALDLLVFAIGLRQRRSFVPLRSK